MSKCPRCGYRIIEDTMIFCPTCAAPLEADSADADLSTLAPSSGAIKHIAQATPRVTVGRVRHERLGEMDPPEGVTPPFKFESLPDGNGAQGSLVDAKGRAWYLFRNRPGADLYHWRRRVVKAKRKKGGGFDMAMRLTRGEPSMYQIAADWNHRQWAIDAAGYRNVSLEQALVGTARNREARKSQGSVMGKFFADVAAHGTAHLPAPLNTITREEAERALALCEKGSLSASLYTGREDQEWLHLRGHGLGGREEPSNLVAGSHGANSEMAAVEMVLQQFDGKRPLTYSVKADCFPGTLISIVIVMTVHLNGSDIYHHAIATTRERLSAWEYAQIQDELVNRIVTDGRKGREIRFVPGSFL
jgi:hypothetical protein